MVTRRSIVKASLALPFASWALAGCDASRRPAVSAWSEGMYLSGNYAPVDIEVTATDLPVTGKIPEELVGRYLRNGPNPLGDVDPASHHWFTGDGMVHGIRLDGGRAEWYRNRWVRNERIVGELGEAVGGRVLGGTPNTNVIGHAGRTWALVESGPAPVEMSYELDTIGVSKGWPGYTAHPKIDPDTGELHAIAYDWANLRDHVKYLVIDRNAQLKKSLDIPLGGMPMIHDMSLTKQYVVIYDLPVTVSLLDVARGLQFPFRWDPDHGARIGLLPRTGTPDDIIWSSLPAQYAYHPMNAYEDDRGNVVIDIVRYDRMFDADRLGPFGDSEPRLARWTVNPSARTVAEDRIDDRPQEFPRCHPALNSKPYQFGYTLGAQDLAYTSIIKHDMKTGASDIFSLGEGHHGGEAYFVPRQGAQSEDDGYLMSIVYIESARRSDLVIFDARDPARDALARVHLPARVPYGFHGNWVPDAA
ncbi:MAG: carotenoid oxygenase family protein [Pseudomonadales bacterium]|nr:carotenoid oxygenase family protein [Pseudomonadales bacterium]